eukprot:7299061-Prymnesium_polylepis.1
MHLRFTVPGTSPPRARNHTALSACTNYDRRKEGVRCGALVSASGASSKHRLVCDKALVALGRVPAFASGALTAA